MTQPGLTMKWNSNTQPCRQTMKWNSNTQPGLTDRKWNSDTQPALTMKWNSDTQRGVMRTTARCDENNVEQIQRGV